MGGCCGGNRGNGGTVPPSAPNAANSAPAVDADGGYLNWDRTVKYVFFKWWTAATPTSFKLTCFLLILFSFLYEGLLNFRSRLDAHLARQRSSEYDHKSQFTAWQNVVRAILHGFSYYVSQVLMMIFMAYNGYFCVSLVLGRALGYLFFAIFLPEVKTVERPKSCCG